jgi:Putative phage tail protein
MPPAIPIIAAVAGAAAFEATAGAVTAYLACDAFGASVVGALGISAATGGTLVAGLAGFAVSSGVSAVGSRAFAPKKAQPNLNTDPQSRAQMLASTVETHKIIYGRAKVSGPILYIGTTNSGPIPSGGPVTGINVMLHMVIALAGHEIDAVETVYLNDKPITLDANGYANSLPYAESGTANQATVSSAVRTSEVVTVTTASAHGFATGDLVTLAVTTDLSMNGDFIITSVSSSTTFTYANGGPNASATGGTATDQTISDAVNSFVRVKTHNGAEGQAADTDMLAEIPGWTTAHQLSGIAYLYVRLQYSQDVFSAGIPNVSAILRGKKVYDPRTGITGWGDNVALCIRDYLTSGYGFDVPSDEINDTYFAAAANVCDEAVTLTTGGTQARYTCNGVLDTGTAPVDNLNALVAAMAGTVTYVQGQFRGHAGVYESPVGDITLNMMVDKFQVHARTPRQQLFNAVKGTFVDPAQKFATTDFPAVTNDTYTAADGGTQLFKDIQLPFTNHPEAAQRIAKVVLEQARQGLQVQLILNHTAIPFAVWDTVTFTDPALGWDHKVFRIRKFSSAGIGMVALSLQEESSAAYDWNNGEATVLDPAPDSNLPDPFQVSVAIGVAYNSRAVTTTGGDTVYNLVLSWDVHEDAFVVHGGQVEIQYKLSSEIPWRPSFFVAGDQSESDLLTSSVNVSYDLRIRAVSSLGARSPWVEIDNAIIGSSGGVTFSEDWGDFHSSPGSSEDWGDFTTSPGSTDDWGYYT